MASDRFSRLKKAAEAKKAQKPGKAGEKAPLQKPREDAKAPAPKQKAEARAEPARKAEPAGKKETAAPPPPAKKALQPPPPSSKKQKAAGEQQKPEEAKPSEVPIFRQIIEAVKADPRVKDIELAARVVSAARGRQGEIESKSKSVKEVVDEEVKRLLTTMPRPLF